jgi:hypothetical protein
VVTALLMPPVAAAQQSNGAGLGLTVVSEFVDPKERISGGAVVGAVYLDDGAAIDLDAVYAHFPVEFEAPVEAQISTVDGRYLAELISDGAISASGWQRLELSTRQHGFLDAYGPEQVAILIIDADTGAVIPARWGAPGSTEYVRFQLNAEGANAYFVFYDENDDARPMRCAGAPGTSSFKFDQVCDVPTEQIRDDRGFVNVKRKRGIDWGRPIEINVAVDP